MLNVYDVDLSRQSALILYDHDRSSCLLFQ
jgi:hypothetical protein